MILIIVTMILYTKELLWLGNVALDSVKASYKHCPAEAIQFLRILRVLKQNLVVNMLLKGYS